MNQYSPELARALFEEAGDALFLFEPDTDRLLAANNMAERLTGFVFKELLQFRATELFRYDIPGGEQQLRRAASHTGIFHSQEGYVLRTSQDGIWVPVNISIARLHVPPRPLALMTARDVREQRAAHDRLRRVEAELRRVLASVSDCIWSAQGDGHRWAFRYVSPVVEKITGQPPEFFLHDFQHWRNLVHPEDRPRWEQALHRQSQCQPTQEEYRLLRPDGAIRWVRDSVRISKAKTGTLLRLDGVLTDITDWKVSQEALLDERHRAAEALAQERNLLRTLIDHLPDHVFIKDTESRFVLVNEATVRTLGAASLEVVLGKTDFDFSPRERAEQFFADEQQVVNSGEPLFNREELVIDAAGQGKWYLTSKLPLRDARETVIGLVGISHDITARRQADQERARLLAHTEQARAEAEAAAEALRVSEQQYRALAEAIPQLVWTAAADGRPDYFNRRWQEYTGDEARLPAALHPDDRSRFLDDWAAAVRSGCEYQAEYRFRRGADGSHRWHLGRAVPVHDRQGQVARWFGTFTDIDDQKQYADALRQARDAAEAANRAKSDFLATVSHEIRTPMNGILGMTELALDTELTPRQRDYLALVKSSADSLLTIINDLLDFSKIEAGKLELDLCPFDLRDTLGDTLKALASRAEARGLELACRVAPATPDTLIGDPGRLRQIIVNLVGNAIKFTRQGEVVVTVSVSSDQSTGISNQLSVISDQSSATSKDSPGSSLITDHCSLITLHFEVRDTGIGIPADKQRRIFQAFEQADTSVTREYGGTGLGLAISSRLVQMMGGEIWVQSEPGQGSTFHFTARFALGRAATVAPTPPVSLEGLKVLVVDDNATNRRILEEMLTAWEMRPALADGAARALQLLEEARQADEPFVLLLVDVHMPEADGFSLIEQVRQRPGLAGAAVMMLTSGDRPGDAARSRELGVRAYLTKPVKQSDLFNSMVAALRPTSGDRGSGAGQDASAADLGRLAPRRPLRVLLAEDNLVNQTLIVCRLEQRGDRVVVAGTGREALAVWEREPFDVVLMDVQMPEMSGFEATAAIRAREAAGEGPLPGHHTPIIALTASAMKGDRERCLAAGMDAYIPKPIRAAELFRVMDELTRPQTRDRETGEGLDPRPLQPDALKPGDGSASSLPAPPDAGDPSVPLLDQVEVRRRMGDNPRLLGRLVNAFFEEAPRLLAELRTAVAASDTTGVRRGAHTLKGAVANFGAHEAVASALRLETMGREGNLNGVEEALATLEQSLDRLRPALLALAGQGQG
jgi:two-component system, sensor histidine kinase and response regulator